MQMLFLQQLFALLDVRVTTAVSSNGPFPGEKDARPQPWDVSWGF